MNEKHTPGPWTFALDAHGRGIVMGNGCWVATTWTVADDDTSARFPAEANARLIAASPALLAACKGLLSFIDNVTPNGPLKDGKSAKVDAARAAIALAGGGE